MFGSDILEVAIAMAFLYLFMSTIASALREAFEAYLQHRAVDLERGLIEMLRTGEDRSFVEKFYNHPLISSLYMGAYPTQGGKPDGARGAEPRQTQGDQSDQNQGGESGPNEGAKPKPTYRLPAYIPKESFSLAVLDIVDEASEAGRVLSLPDLETKLNALRPPNAVQRVVLTAFATAGHDLGAVRKYLEDWYDSAMERVTGWYTRRTAVFLFVFGFGAAVFLNVDSITIAKRLIVDRPLRQAIVAQAEKYQSDKTGAPPAPAAPPAAAPPPAGAGPTPPGAVTDANDKSFMRLRSEFEDIGFPIGWTSVGYWPYPAPQACLGTSSEGGTTFDCSKSAGVVYYWIMLLALMGWLVTAIAIMLGAPFWFDLLNKLISLRSALKPTDDTPKAKTTKRKSGGPQQPAPTHQSLPQPQPD